MIEVSREEAERGRMLDERSNYRHAGPSLRPLRNLLCPTVSAAPPACRRCAVCRPRIAVGLKVRNDPSKEAKNG